MIKNGVVGGLLTGNARGFMQLRAGTALAALAVGSYFAPIGVEQAQAANCGSGNSDGVETITCQENNTDNNGVSVLGTSNVSVIMKPGSVITNGGNSTSLNVTLVTLGSRYVNIDMDQNSSITGSGTQINVTGGGPVTGAWDVDGVVNSTGSNAIVVNAVGGTGSGLTMNIGPNGEVRAAKNAITVNSAGGVLNYSLNNQGTILAGDDGVNVFIGPVSTGESTVNINNTGVMGSEANPIGEIAV